MTPFVHLHTHSDYSLLRGMCQIEALVQKTLDSGMDAVALTDQGNMFGILELSLECRKTHEDENGKKTTFYKPKPILGVEAYMAPKGHRDPSNESPLGHDPFPVVLLAENQQGYVNLCLLVSKSFQHGFSGKPRIDFELLSAHKEGVIVLSGGTQSELSRLVLRGDEAGARRLATRYRDLLGPEHYFLELVDHGLADDKTVNRGLLALGRELGIEPVATNQVHYLEVDDAYAHEILLCIESKASIYQEKGIGRDKRPALPGTGWHFATGDEMAARFPEAPEAIANTVKIAARCDVRLGKDKPHMAVVEVPEGRTHLEHLREECRARLIEKLGTINEVYEKQLEFELSVISKMGFPSYFLIVADFVNEAKRRGILVGPGRGSAAGSLVSYAMGITNLDPIHHGLLFERFLNPERVNLPDIDMDFQDTRREEVIGYIREHFGHEKVSQIVTYGKLKAKAILKDVARVFGVDFAAANKLSSLIPADPKMTLEKAWATSAEFKEAILSQAKFQEVYRHACKLEGLTRQVGVHAAGVIIADKSLDQYVPLYVADGVTVTQYEGSVLEDACGLIKMDILGLATLSILDESMRLIKEHHGVAIDLDKLPFDDLKTFSIFARGKTHGIFQFESEGMRKNLIELKPNTLDDLVAMNAMYRPGPMAWIPVYIAKKHNRVPEFKDPGEQENYMRLEALVARTPSLQKILLPTNLIPIYQEQIMEIGREYAGFSLGEADMMRRAMGKKKIEILEEYKAKFVSMAQDKGHAPDDSVFLFEKIILPFAGYGFNKSHAACYAVVAYQTAWLKANYPECFMTALLNNEIEDTDKIREYVDEARSLSLTVVPPDINKSGLTFSIEGGRIRYGLAAVKGVGQAAGSALLAERDKGGPFATIADFRERLTEGKTNKQVVEQLVRAGAFDALGLDAGQIFHILPELEKRIGVQSALTAGGQTSLFAAVESTPGASHDDLLGKGRAFRSDPEALKEMEKEGLGFNLKRDPLAIHGRFLTALSSIHSTMEIDPNSWKGKPGQFAGVLLSLKKIVTKKNEEMVFATLENTTGKMECTFFPEAWRNCQNKTGPGDKPLLVTGGLLIVKGNAKMRDGKVQVLADDVLPFDMEKIPKSAYREIHVRFNRPVLAAEELDGLHAVLHQHWGGNCGVVLHFPQDGAGDIRMRAGDALTVTVNSTLEAQVKNLPFVERSWYR